jgi:hypothetical protein
MSLCYKDREVRYYTLHHFVVLLSPYRSVYEDLLTETFDRPTKNDSKYLYVHKTQRKNVARRSMKRQFILWRGLRCNK